MTGVARHLLAIALIPVAFVFAQTAWRIWRCSPLEWDNFKKTGELPPW